MDTTPAKQEPMDFMNQSMQVNATGCSEAVSEERTCPAAGY